MAGYDGFSKSNNALSAESRGLCTAGVVARKFKVSAAAVESVLRPREWHHVSKFFTAKNYYDLDDISESDVEKMKRFDAENAATDGEFRATISWLEWAGTRKHPTATNFVATGTVTKKKSTYKIRLDAGREFTKREGTRGFSVVRIVTA